MAAPNLNSTSMIATAAVDTLSPAGLSEVVLTSAVPANHTYITLSLTAANNTSLGAAITVNWFDGAGSHRLVVTSVVPAFAQMEVTPTRKFLLEGWSVKVTVGTTSAIEFTHHYLDCH